MSNVDGSVRDQAVNTPLDHHVVIHTPNPQQAEEFIESTLQATVKAAPHRMSRVTVKANCFTLEKSEAWFCSYGIPITLQFPESDIFRIQFHHKGQGSTRIGAKEYAITPDQAVISSSATTITFGEDFEQTVLRFSQSALTQRIVALTGQPLIRPLEFVPVFNPSVPQTNILKQTFDFLIRQVNLPNVKIPALVLNDMEQTLITMFLCFCPNTYTDLLTRQSAKAAPSQVCRIEEYIEANWDRPITIEDIVALSGCSARSIYRAFQHHRGYSPMAFIKQVRLRHAREMLMNQPITTIAHVAFACGFTDLSRFSQTYVHMFGELPSHTLRCKNK